QLDTDVLAGVQTIPATATSNCGSATGGTYVTCTGNATPVPQCTAANTSVLTNATGFAFSPGTLTTSGGTRNVGQVGWARSDGNILGVVNWDGPATGTTPA